MHATLMRLLAAALMLVPAPGLAAGCAIAGGDIAFGRLDAVSRDPQHAIGSISLRCDGAEGSLVRIGLGSGNAARSGQRELRDGERSIRYDLYVDPAHERVFGDDSPGAPALEVALPAAGELLSIPVYAVIAGAQSLQPGEYSDQIVVTVDF